MNKFEPDYTKCEDSRKELTGLSCKYCWKNDIMVCSLTKKPCIAWKGYKHDFEVKETKEYIKQFKEREKLNKEKK